VTAYSRITFYSHFFGQRYNSQCSQTGNGERGDSHTNLSAAANTMSIRPTLLFSLALLAIGVSPAVKAKSLDRTAAVREIEHTIDTTYVFPALRPKIIAQLERSRRANHYNVEDPELFAQRVTADLEAGYADRRRFASRCGRCTGSVSSKQLEK
jgi:hypothetical protein